LLLDNEEGRAILLSNRQLAISKRQKAKGKEQKAQRQSAKPDLVLRKSGSGRSAYPNLQARLALIGAGIRLLDCGCGLFGN